MGGIRKEREDYIPVSGPANRNQRILAKQAILGLLQKGGQTSREIAEHFGLSEESVNILVKELIKAGYVKKYGIKSPLFGLKDSWKSS